MKFMNSKEIKNFLKANRDISRDYVFIEKNGEVYIASLDLKKFDFSGLNIKSIGLRV